LARSSRLMTIRGRMETPTVQPQHGLSSMAWAAAAQGGSTELLDSFFLFGRACLSVAFEVMCNKTHVGRTKYSQRMPFLREAQATCVCVCVCVCKNPRAADAVVSHGCHTDFFLRGPIERPLSPFTPKKKKSPGSNFFSTRNTACQLLHLKQAIAPNQLGLAHYYGNNGPPFCCCW
jgi:hypothetical protein